MIQIKQTLAAVLSLILLFIGCVVPVFAYDNEFTDVPSDAWEAPYVYSLVSRGILNGYGDGTFGPLQTVQRCEYAKMLVCIADTPLSTSITSPYVDVTPDAWYFSYVNSSLPFITGFTANGVLTFRPEENATREDVTVALVKAMGLDISSYENPMAYLEERFWDLDTISVHNRAYIAAAVDQGIITGNEDKSFRGQDSIIRAEVVAILCRAFPSEPVAAVTTLAAKN